MFDQFEYGSGQLVQEEKKEKYRLIKQIAIVFLKGFLFAAKGFLILFFPFFVLLRSSIYFYQTHHWNHWLALIVSIGLTALVLVGYTFFISIKVLKKNISNGKQLKIVMITIFAILLVYTGYCTFYISAKNTKGQGARGQFYQLHPLLRLALGTIIFFDNKTIATDFVREGDDYDKMGLKKNSHSLHYVQHDGYVHAVDIRTNNRSALRNFLIKVYFKIIGLHPIRHVGAGDHLHVQLEVQGSRVVK